MIRESNEVRKPFFLVRGAPNSFHRVTRVARTGNFAIDAEG